MAKMAMLPGKDAIDMLAGIIDYYAYLGIPCARMLPTWKGKLTAGTKAQWGPFSYVNKVARQLPPKVVQQWSLMIYGTYLTWKDMLNRAYLGHTFNPVYLPRTMDWNTSPDRFLILNWEMTESAYYWYFTFYTDVACRLWLMRLEDLPRHQVITRLRRGYDEYLDVYHQYRSEASESPAPYPETKEHHWTLNKEVQIYRNGFWFYASIAGEYLSSISQYFSPGDLGL